MTVPAFGMIYSKRMMSILKRFLVSPAINFGIGISVCGATSMFTAVQKQIPAYFHLGGAMVLTGCILCAYGGYVAGEKAGQDKRQ